MSEVKRMKYCVNGEWLDSKTEKYMPITDSSTGEVIAEVPSCTVEECEAAIAAADEAFKSWSTMSMAKRVQYLFKWREVLYAHKEELSILCAKELGKTLKKKCNMSSIGILATLPTPMNTLRFGVKIMILLVTST